MSNERPTFPHPASNYDGQATTEVREHFDSLRDVVLLLVRGSWGGIISANSSEVGHANPNRRRASDSEVLSPRQANCSLFAKTLPDGVHFALRPASFPRAVQLPDQTTAGDYWDVLHFQIQMLSLPVLR